jgi:hypothetical protein
LAYTQACVSLLCSISSVGASLHPILVCLNSANRLTSGSPLAPISRRSQQDPFSSNTTSYVTSLILETRCGTLQCPCVSRGSFLIHTRPFLPCPSRFTSVHIHVHVTSLKTLQPCRSTTLSLTSFRHPPKFPYSFLFITFGYHSCDTRKRGPLRKNDPPLCSGPFASTLPPKSKASNSSPPDDEHRLVSGTASGDLSVPLSASHSQGSSVLDDILPIGLLLPPRSVVAISDHALRCKDIVSFYYWRPIYFIRSGRFC